MTPRPSRRLVTLVGGLLVAILAASGCTGDTEATGGSPTGASPSGALPTSAVSTRTADSNVIDFNGLRGVEFGASRAQLGAAGVVATAGPICGPSFTAIDAARPVFDGDRLVLIWAHPPLRTPEGVMVGTSVQDARRAYPSAVALTPPAGSTTFPGLLVTGGGDRAYLLLHSDGQIQKLIVGLERYARLLFNEGFGTC